ncbi:MAG: ferritin-like domain-containing protein [bacterium]
MSPVNADSRVLGYLGRALSLELSAVQMYSTQAKLCEAWGLSEVAERMGNEAREEMGHAERIIARMVGLGVAPNASQLRPVKLGSSLQQLLESNHAFENELITLYSQAVAHCKRIGDHDNRVFFEALLGEEQHHADEWSSWLKELDQTA